MRDPLVPWIFWPLVTTLGLLGLIFCVLLGAMLQGILLVLGLVLGGAWWLAQSQLAFSAGFFLFVFGGVLAVPWVLWKPTRSYPSLWIAISFFEVIFGLYAVRAADLMGPEPLAQTLPLFLAILKIPFVVTLVSNLKGQPARNAILAAQGGALLFYLSCLPVLFLEGGWVGLSFTAEAVALLWLNRRVAHPGLRWTALIMAPLGAYFVAMHIVDMRGLDSLPLANPGYIALALATLLLFGARRLAAWPTAGLQGWPWSSDDAGPQLEPAPVFRSYTAVAGLILLQWGLWEIASPERLPSLLAQSYAWGDAGRLVLPLLAFWGHSLTLATVSGLVWVAYGLALLLSPAQLRDRLRVFGLFLMIAASLKLGLLPLSYRQDYGALLPLLNLTTFVLGAAIAAWSVLLLRKGGPAWPLRAVSARVLGAVILVALTFWFMNVQISSVLKESGAPFTFSTQGFLARQLGFSIGWLVFGVVLLALGLSKKIKALCLAGMGLLAPSVGSYRLRAGLGQKVQALDSPADTQRHIVQEAGVSAVERNSAWSPQVALGKYLKRMG